MLAYDSTLRVPLILSGPGVTVRTVDAPVSLVDLAPSLLNRAGIQSAAQANHQNLFGAVAADRDAYWAWRRSPRLEQDTGTVIALREARVPQPA